MPLDQAGQEDDRHKHRHPAQDGPDRGAVTAPPWAQDEEAAAKEICNHQYGKGGE
jgi:hypothetical protein